MSLKNISRREFLETAAVAAATLAPGYSALAQALATQPSTLPVGKRTATDLVDLGKTGLKCTRLGLGLGSNNGQVQLAGGSDVFNKFIKHAYDQGITFYDTAQSYSSFSVLGAAIKDLPREKIFIQCKVEQPNNMLATLDNHRKVLNTDYIDSMLIHIQTRPNWTDTWKQAMDDFDAAVEKKWIKSKGVSYHSLPAMRLGIDNKWSQVHLIRVNPQGLNIDNEQANQRGNAPNDVNPIVEQIKRAGDKGHGVIGMKIYANGALRTDEEREKSLRFACSIPQLHAMIIGFANTDQMDQCVKLMNKVLAEPAAA
jgi:1-deoxyxylulose-5-phosphate synthase